MAQMKSKIISMWGKWNLKYQIGKQAGNNIQIAFEECFFKNSLYIMLDVASGLSKIILYNVLWMYLEVKNILSVFLFNFL